MGALINIDYNPHVVKEDEATILAKSIHVLVTDAMGEKDVFVYANSKHTTVGADPIEIFIQVNQQKMVDPEGFMKSVSEKIVAWKQQSDFRQPINLNVIPVTWHSKIGI